MCLVMSGWSIYMTHTSFLMMLEWIIATPLTAWDPMMHRWAMFTLFPPSSSIRDILRKRSISPGNRDAMCYKNTQIHGCYYFLCKSIVKKKSDLYIVRLTSRCIWLIWYMICKWRGRSFSSRWTGQRSRASGSTVWLVYANVCLVRSHAYTQKWRQKNYHFILNIIINIKHFFCCSSFL